LVGDFLGTLAAGLGGAALAFFATTFFVVVFFTGAFLLVALALDAAVVPVIAFFAGARLLAAVVFFAGAALALPAGTFLVAGALGLAVVVVVVFLADEGLALLVVGTVLALAAPALGLEAGLIEGTLEAGLFSLADVSAGLDLGANLTLPEGPLGRTKTPFSAPALMAFASWVV